MCEFAFCNGIFNEIEWRKKNVVRRRRKNAFVFNCSFPFVNNRNESVIVSLLGISRNDRLFGKSNWNVWSHSKIYEDEFSNITVGWIIILSHREHRTHFGCTFFFLSRSLSLITRAHTQKNVRRLAAILSSLFSLVFIQNWKSVNCVCVCVCLSRCDLLRLNCRFSFYLLIEQMWLADFGRQKCKNVWPVFQFESVSFKLIACLMG